MNKIRKASGRLVFWSVFVLFCAAAGFAQQQDTKSDDEIYAFGYDIFRATQEPITEGPVDEEYLLSPGDEVIVSVWGQLALSYPLTVSEDGYIDIPDEGGRIYTNGVKLRELRRLVTERLSRIYSAYINAANPAQSTAYVDVKLGKIRKLLVYVLGEVEKQGVYTISSSVSTLLNLLNNAEGIKRTGSLRDIRIRRASGQVDTVDLYDLLVTGRIDTKKTRLVYGDYVIVPLKRKSVTIMGEVKRPGIYELIGEEGIKELIEFAGGFESNAYLDRAQVKRFEINLGERLFDLNLKEILDSPGDNFPLLDGDEVTIFEAKQERRPIVRILGEGIMRPGVYEYRDGLTVQDLIKQAEGLKESANLVRADLIRTQDDFTKKLSIFSLQDLYSRAEDGRFVLKGGQEANFSLEKMDEIIIYSDFEMRGQDKFVSLEGHVKKPGRFVLPENMTLFDLIFSRGGFQDEEFKKSAFLELAHVFRKIPGQVDEEILTFNLGGLLEGSSVENMLLEDGDRVVIYAYEILEVKPFVNIEGLVNKPGRYNLVKNLTLEDLILLAGGLRPDAYIVEAIIGRLKPGMDEAVKSLIIPIMEDFSTLSPDQKTSLEAYDEIVIRNTPEGEPLPVVSIRGEVKYPGNYSLPSRSTRIAAIIQRSGGLKISAFPEGAVLFRRTDIITMSPNSNPVLEKVSINLKKALLFPTGKFDLILENGDYIFIPPNPMTVEVKGAVNKPALFQFRTGAKINDYIEMAGGFAPGADRSELIVQLPNQEAARRKMFLFFKLDVKVLPGSVIEVPFRGAEKTAEYVEVRGAVVRPMLIQFRERETLDYYIDLCGGYKRDADIYDVVVHGKDGQAVERYGIGLFNPVIQPGSVIAVPFVSEIRTVASERIGEVEVRGAVRYPMAVRFVEGKPLAYYIGFCGGLQANSDALNMIIRYPDGRLVERGGEEIFEPEIVPGCILEIPLIEEFADQGEANNAQRKR